MNENKQTIDQIKNDCLTGIICLTYDKYLAVRMLLDTLCLLFLRECVSTTFKNVHNATAFRLVRTPYRQTSVPNPLCPLKSQNRGGLTHSQYADRRSKPRGARRKLEQDLIFFANKECYSALQRRKVSSAHHHQKDKSSISWTGVVGKKIVKEGLHATNRAAKVRGIGPTSTLLDTRSLPGFRGQSGD